MAHYVAFNGRHLAAIIIGYDINQDAVDLAVFTNMQNVNGDKNFGLQFHSGIAFDDGDGGLQSPKPGTWHWPERV